MPEIAQLLSSLPSLDLDIIRGHFDTNKKTELKQTSE